MHADARERAPSLRSCRTWVTGLGIPGRDPRFAAEARAWSSFTLASIDRESARSKAAHVAEQSPQFLTVSLPAFGVQPVWFVKFEGDAPFDSATIELLQYVAA